jgi:hypothetical protein
MDADRFDSLARLLTTIRSRRSVGRLLGDLSLGGVLAGFVAAGPKAASANQDKSKVDRRCKGKPAISDNVCPSGGSGCDDIDEDCLCTKTIDRGTECLRFEGEGCSEVDECDQSNDCTGKRICAKVGGCCGGKRNRCLRRCAG